MTIDHIALYVYDLEKARDFFETYFSALSGPLYHNRTTGFRSYFLSFEGGSRLELMTRPGLPDGGQPVFHPGFIHLAMNLGSKAAVDALTARLCADGYPILSGPRTTGDGYYESCILGPEGNQIELTV